MSSPVRFAGNRRKQLYRVMAWVEGQDGEARWEPLTGPLTHAKAMSEGWKQERAGRTVRLEDAPRTTAATSRSAPAAQLELTK